MDLDAYFGVVLVDTYSVIRQAKGDLKKVEFQRIQVLWQSNAKQDLQGLVTSYCIWFITQCPHELTKESLVGRIAIYYLPTKLLLP